MIEYGDQGYCIAVASDKETVVMQDYDAENEYNKWYISRIGFDTKLFIYKCGNRQYTLL